MRTNPQYIVGYLFANHHAMAPIISQLESWFWILPVAIRNRVGFLVSLILAVSLPASAWLTTIDHYCALLILSHLRQAIVGYCLLVFLLIWSNHESTNSSPFIASPLIDHQAYTGTTIIHRNLVAMNWSTISPWLPIHEPLSINIRQ